ncbi:MAG: 50S ribosomal protein L11 methyltransferase, partial [Clostridiales bacterium]|nr:50S ribosomal protein L11 methyltransferase [Clostridiales bacterium]
MEWVKARIATTSEGVEPVFGALLNCGVAGAEIIDAAEMKRFLSENPFSWDYVDESLTSVDSGFAEVVFYVPDSPEGNETLLNIKSALAKLSNDKVNLPAPGALSLTVETVNDESWLHEWKKHYKPFRVGCSLVVVPMWEEYEPSERDLIITLDPGSVFGTGMHPTTQLCMEALEDFIRPGASVLDIGCGSGILSIAALRLGASSAFGCDIDPAVEQSVSVNRGLNALTESQLAVRNGDIFNNASLRSEIASRPYDVVVSNIVADVIIGLTGYVPRLLAGKGLFIASGIIDERYEETR